MTDLEKKLSYLLDDYPGDDKALDEVIEDVNLQYSMRRYQMIGEVMRHELPSAVDTGFHNRVMEQVRAEASNSGERAAAAQPSSAPASSVLGWLGLKPVAGFAVAAAVAVVTVALWQPVQQPGADGTEVAVSDDQQKIEALVDGPAQANAVPASLGMRWKVEKDMDMPGLQQKLNAYLVNHTEYSNSMQGLIPQARVAGFDAQQQ